jgi:glycosyltransferase involved in cell wall biosynthesis
VRVTVIAPPWLAVPPVGYGGIEAVLDTLCRGLSAAGHDVLLYATGDSTTPVDRAWTFDVALGVENASPCAELRHVIDAYQAAADWGADIVHDHTLSGPFYARQRPAVDVVTTNHGPFDEDLAPLYRALAGRVPLIAISHHQASTAGATPVTAVIHHGVDLEQFPMGMGTGGYALSLGRMNPNKGIHTAIHAARAAGIPLRIAAKMREPAEHEYYRRCVEPLLGDGIEYVGEVHGTAKLRLLAEATCLLNPIAWPEPFGMVMIEALACGTPVVATPCGASPEIVACGVTGHLRAHVPGLAEALTRVHQIDRRACRASVAERFSLTRLAADHALLYERVLARRAGEGTTRLLRSSRRLRQLIGTNGENALTAV